MEKLASERSIMEISEFFKEKIFQDITDPETVYFAPEYNSWKEYLSSYNDSSDYHKVLEEEYEEEQLEKLWQASHVMEDLETGEIKNRILTAIGRLKMIEILRREDAGTACRIDREYQEQQRAVLKGLYNLLYEE